MNGVIALVDENKNSAILVDKDKKQYSFNLEDCIGFDYLPEIGDNVEFELNSEEIFFVKLIKKENNKNINNKPDTNPLDIPIVDKKVHTKIDVNIPLDRDVKDCLDNYFDEVISTIYEYEAEFEDGETLNFILMKRFLNTAYNNLRDMDSTFMDEYLLELKGDLAVLESVYRKFHKKNIVPQMAYDSIFLEQQTTYQKYKKIIEVNTSELYILKTTIKSLESQIEMTQKEIQNTKVLKHTEIKEKELKRYNKYYVDTIHRSGNLKDENIRIKESLEKFEEEYRKEFISIYDNEARKYDKFIRKQLDGYAYEFDKKMWEAAENSTAIRSFFKRANIDDDFSSKTFLKYFIKGLDETKFSKEHKRLYSLLEYLEGRAKVRILIVSENLKESDRIKHLIRSFDKEYSVEVSNKPRSSYYRKDLARLDIIFVELSIKNPNIYEFIDMMKKRFIQSNSHAVLCITSSNFTKENLIKLKEKDISYLLATNLTEEELQHNIKEIIDSLHE
jgi:hypothetical protein